MQSIDSSNRLVCGDHGYPGGDVLAFATNESLLITGLLNPQVVRTAMMLDMRCIVFVCGKIPTPEIISLARENGIVLLVTDHYMFTASGRLYATGMLRGE